MAKDKLYSLSPLGKDKNVVVVNISDLKVSADPKTTLVTYALGSCIAVTLYDPRKQVGGLLHFLLPERGPDHTSHEKSLMTFADTGLELLLEKVLQLGAVKGRLQVKVIGGANLFDKNNSMDVGHDNYQALLKALEKHGLFVCAEDVGGDYGRTAMLEIDSGTVNIRSQGKITRI
ncbi:chemotaxis protein CheD [Planctomycetota bacterium]